MKEIGIVGLGLIGGSLAKALSAHQIGTRIGFDQNKEVLQKALKESVISRVGSREDYGSLDYLFVALYPRDTVSFIREALPLLKRGCIVVDLCGVKSYICRELSAVCKEHGVCFIGGHPMAGREFSGYDYAIPSLFEGASLILTPTESTNEEALLELEALARELGFQKVVRTTPENHDRMIAFTSQLAHLVSSAYIKSPEATRHNGYSAGSYKDLTRVAKLNEVMWSELFLLNAEALLGELDEILFHLKEYRDAIALGDRDTLTRLLREGRERKESIDRI